MATPGEQSGGQFERSIQREELEAHLFAAVRELLEETGGGAATVEVRGGSRLAADLGLGSLERVELLVRLERSFDTRLPERVIAEAESLDEVIAALGEHVVAEPGAVGRARLAPAVRSQPIPKTAATIPARATAPLPVAAQTWQEVLQYRAAANAGETHLIIYESEGEPRALTFDALYEQAQAVAAGLIERGIVPGDAVALMLPTGQDFYLSFAGVLLAGGVPVPIYPPTRADRIAEYVTRQSAILRNSEARLLITFAEAARAARLLGPQIPSLRGIVTTAELQKPPAQKHPSSSTRGSAGRPRMPHRIPARIPKRQGDDLALLQYTSGSTDDPKGVQLTNLNLLASVKAMGEAIAAGPGDVCVTWLPLYHDMGLIGMWLAPLYYGLPVVVHSPLSFLSRPESWLMALSRHRGTITAAPNFAYELCVRKISGVAIEGVDLSSVRAMMNGAEPVSPETLERFTARFAAYGLRREALTPVYGLAEASLGVAIPPPGRGPVFDRVVRETFEREGRAVPAGGQAPNNHGGGQKTGRRAGGVIEPETALGKNAAQVLSFVSVGAALLKHEIRIADERGEEVPERLEGALWFRGPSCTRGYFHNEAASAKLFPKGAEAGWLNSGDRAYRAGGETFITGRVKDMILKGGRNLYPQEIEEAAGGAAGVRKGCVVAFGVPDAASGTERLVIVAETRKPASAGELSADDDARGANGGGPGHGPPGGEQGSPDKVRAEIVDRVSSAIGLPPDSVELLPARSIPKTSSGKLRRSQTRQRYLAGTLSRTPPPAWRQVARLSVSSGARQAARTVKAGLRRAAEVLYGSYCLVAFALVLLPAWVVILFVRQRRTAARVTTVALRVLLALIGLRVRVRGREHLGLPPPVMWVSNHTSNIDVIVLMATFGADYHFVAKSEILSWPFLGTFLRKMGHFSFDRSDPRARMRQSEQILEALRHGESVFIFPEGTFTAQEGVRGFQLGAFKAAAYDGCPILPVALRGTRRFMRDHTYLPRPSRITITVCPPIRPKRTTEWREIVRLRDAARSQIQKESGEPML